MSAVSQISFHQGIYNSTCLRQNKIYIDMQPVIVEMIQHI